MTDFRPWLRHLSSSQASSYAIALSEYLLQTYVIF